MVYLNDVILKQKKILLSNVGIPTYCYYYLRDNSKLKNISDTSFGEEDAVAAQGYLGHANTNEIESIIQRKPIKGISWKSNIYKMLGLYLGAKIIVQSHVEEKFNTTHSIKDKYLISKFLKGNFEIQLKDVISQKQDSFSNLYNALLSNNHQKIEINLSFFISKEEPFDIVDLLLLEEAQEFLIRKHNFFRFPAMKDFLSENNKWAITSAIMLLSALGIWFASYLIPPYQQVEEKETCEYAIWLKDNNSLKTITQAKAIFTYENDNYVFYSDSEGFYKGSLECDKKDGKIHIEATGYQVYERNFKLDKNMQEIRLLPERK